MKLALLSLFPSYPDEEYSVPLSFLTVFFETLLSLFSKRPSNRLSFAARVPGVLSLIFYFPLSFEPLNHIPFKLYSETLHLLWPEIK